MADETTESPVDRDQRRRVALRLLVDEMLAQIRATSRADHWSPEERARAEQDLDRIMGQVRREAMRELGSADR
ncbi:MAG TPA: hypothetical protein VEA99_19605 [Gemmatimonadaceae bacterium]|nr:hypothetical protein [Gemmatimonadaceae bacterium]